MRLCSILLLSEQCEDATPRKCYENDHLTFKIQAYFIFNIFTDEYVDFNVPLLPKGKCDLVRQLLHDFMNDPVPAKHDT